MTLIKNHKIAFAYLVALLVIFALWPIDGGIGWDKAVWRDWGSVMNSYSLKELYAPQGPTLSADHLPGDMIIYKLVQMVYATLGFTSYGYSYTLAYKLIAIGSLLSLPLIISNFLNNWEIKHDKSIVILAITLNPFFLIDGPWWGQWDIFSLTLCALAITLVYSPNSLTYSKGISSIIIAAWVCLMKPQLFILLAPFFFLALIKLWKEENTKRKIMLPLSGIAISLLFNLLILKIFDLTITGEKSLFSIIDFIGNIHLNLSLATPINFYWFIVDTNVPPAQMEILGFNAVTVASIIRILVLLTIIVSWLSFKVKELEKILLGASFLFLSYFCFSLITHERYMIPALLPMVLWAIVSGKKTAWFAYSLVAFFGGLAGFLVAATHGSNVDPLNFDPTIVLSLCAFAIISAWGILAYEWTKLFQKVS